MPQIFRKSFTACEQFAALPPTPRRKSRPPRSRRSARSVAVRSMASRSKRPRISAASCRCCLTNSIERVTPKNLRQQHFRSLEVEAEAHFLQSRLPHGLTQRRLVFRVEHKKPPAPRPDELAAERAMLQAALVPLVDVGVA